MSVENYFSTICGRNVIGVTWYYMCWSEQRISSKYYYLTKCPARKKH